MSKTNHRADQGSKGDGSEIVIELPCTLEEMAGAIAPGSDPGFTGCELADQLGITRNAAVGRAEAKVRGGRWLKGKAFRNSRHVTVYRPNPEFKEN